MRCSHSSWDGILCSMRASILIMIFVSTYVSITYIKISTDWLINLLVFVLLIVVVSKTKKKKISSTCMKGFVNLFIMFLIFLMFSTFFDFVHSLTSKMIFAFRDIKDILWGLTYIPAFLNKIIAFVLLFDSMEIYLFNKKSNWKFGILAFILLGGTFIIAIIKIVSYNVMDYLEYQITSVILSILTSLFYLIIGIFILILLRKTAKENILLETYTRPLSTGVIFLLIVRSIIAPISEIAYLRSIWAEPPYEFYYWFDFSLYIISSVGFIIGIIFLAIGAMKTMDVSLTFTKKKPLKKILRRITPRKLTSQKETSQKETSQKETSQKETSQKETSQKETSQKETSQKINSQEAISQDIKKFCIQCGVPIQPGMKFCIQCGKKYI